MRILPSGERAVLIELDDLSAVTGLHHALSQRPPAGVVDLVAAARTILVVAAAGTDLDDLATSIRAVEPVQPDRADTDLLDIPVHYDGPDLPGAAEAMGCSVDEVIDRHQQERWLVAFTGFAPGFGYLVGHRYDWDLPRLAEPRAAVPAGSVALAGEFTGVYPQRSPGGWQLIGRTDLAMFDLNRDPPALLQPGRTIRFTAA